MSIRNLRVFIRLPFFYWEKHNCGWEIGLPNFYLWWHIARVNKGIKVDETIMENCNECKWINFTEDQQIDKRIDHRCLIHKTRLFHGSNNPKIKHNYIYPCIGCNGKDFEQR